MEEVLEFEVEVSPCPIIDFYSDPRTLGTQIYEIGKNSFTFGYTGFIQDLKCGYVIEEKLVG